MTLRERLIQLRTAAGLTQKQLADASGVPVSTLRKIEQGSTGTRYGFTTVVALATVLGVSCEVFVACEDVGSGGIVPASRPRQRAGK